MVHEDPARRRITLNPCRVPALDGLCCFHQSAQLSLTGGVGDDKEIGDGREFAYVEQENVLAEVIGQGLDDRVGQFSWFQSRLLVVVRPTAVRAPVSTF